jgi:hypothetical protein
MVSASFVRSVVVSVRGTSRRESNSSNAFENGTTMVEHVWMEIKES